MTYEEKLAWYQLRCEEALNNAVQNHFIPSSKVSQAASYSLQNGGKRVRGVLVLAVFEMLGGNPDAKADLEAAGAFAAAMEMMHAFSLIHDDLPCMDNAATRRGKPANHMAFGEATALLAGDGLAIEPFHVLANAKLAAEQRLQAVAELAEAAGLHGMVYGQELDLRYETEAADEAALTEVHAHKTVALIRAAAHLGVLAAGREIEKEPAVTLYAENLGRAFQIADDLLDVTASEAALGKPVGGDAAHGKATCVSLLGEEAARLRLQTLSGEATDTLRQAYSHKADFLVQYAEQLAGRHH